jgi:hypothetical protein
MGFGVVGHAAKAFGEFEQFATQLGLARCLRQLNDFCGDLSIIRRARSSGVSHSLAVNQLPPNP